MSGIVLNEDVRWITFHSGCAPPHSPLFAFGARLDQERQAPPADMTHPPGPPAHPPALPRYDFGYLLKLLTCAPLPNTEEEFNELLRIYFPIAYDMKCAAFSFLLSPLAVSLRFRRRRGTEHSFPSAPLAPTSSRRYCMKFCDSLHGGLQKLAEVLDVERIGPQHQAGSDSLLTACTFFKLQKSYFSPESHIGPIEKYKNVLYGARNGGEVACVVRASCAERALTLRGCCAALSRARGGARRPDGGDGDRRPHRQLRLRSGGGEGGVLAGVHSERGRRGWAARHARCQASPGAGARDAAGHHSAHSESVGGFGWPPPLGRRCDGRGLTPKECICG